MQTNKHSFWNLLTDDNGKVSHTKFWCNIAYATSTWVIVHLTINSTLTENYLLWYLAVVAGHTGISKYLTLRAKQQ